MERKTLTTKPYCPSQGDIIHLDFDPRAEREQAGRRPALVLSPYSYNAKTGLAVVCPITSKPKNYPFESPLPDTLPIMGVVLSDHVKSLSWVERNSVFACQAPDDVVEDVRALIAALIQEPPEHIDSPYQRRVRDEP